MKDHRELESLPLPVMSESYSHCCRPVERASLTSIFAHDGDDFYLLKFRPQS